MKRLISLFLILCCLAGLTACGNKEEETGRLMQVYYISNNVNSVEERPLHLKSDTCLEQIDEVLDALATIPAKLEYKAPLAMGFSVKDYQLENGVLVLNMDTHYYELEPSAEILVRAALVYSLTQIENVDYVNILVEGYQLHDNLNNLVGAMSAEQFINNAGSEIGNYETANLVLYFTNEAGDGLIAVNRNKAYNTNISLDRLVVEELIAGPSATPEGVYPTINPDTRAVSVVTKDGICYVNLDQTFLTQIYNVSADVTIYSIVNSLVELSNVNKVQISINGETSVIYREKYNFSTVFDRNLDLVTNLKE